MGSDAKQVCSEASPILFKGGLFQESVLVHIVLERGGRDVQDRPLSQVVSPVKCPPVDSIGCFF